MFKESASGAFKTAVVRLGRNQYQRLGGSSLPAALLTIVELFNNRSQLRKFYLIVPNRNLKLEGRPLKDKFPFPNFSMLLYHKRDLDDYLEGGSDEVHKQLREGYGHIPKPQARKIRNYLYGILEDAWRYNHDKRPGRRKKQTK